MTETGTSVQETPQTEEQQQAAYKTELDQMMQINLNNGIVPHEKTETQVQSTEQQAAVVETQQQLAVDPFGVLKEKFGYENQDAAIKEIEELRVLKANPPAPATIKYENELSEKVAKALQSGKLTEVYKALDQQEKLNELTTIEVNKDSAEKIIKLAIGIKTPNLSPHEIDFQYKNEYVAPKEPVQKSTEEDDDFAERHNEWKERVDYIETKRVIAAKMAQPELELAKSKIVFPETEQKVDDGYTQYLKELEQQPLLDAQVREAYGKFTPKTLETKIKFIDEPNKIDFEFQHEPDGDAFKKTIDIVSDLDKLITHFTKPDGTPDREGFAKAMYFALNHEQALIQAMNQSKNATIKSFLPDNSSGTQRQFPQTQSPSELDAAMQQAGIKRA